MLPYPDIDPVFLDLGVIQIHWYGIMYLCAFSSAWWLGNYRADQQNSPVNRDQVADLIFYGALGAVLGGRIGYILFYNFSVYLQNPLEIFAVWRGGMSFHGGMLGVFFAMWLYGRQQKLSFFTVTDFIAPLVPLGLGFGRLGNFINGELWGAPSTLPWAMIFPQAGNIPRHPSPLYELLLEGIILFFILWFYSKKPRPVRAVSGLFMISYGSFRSFVELFRMPDQHIGYLAYDWLTMGHLLSFPMILFGILLVILAYRKPAASTSTT